jgi:hypothetical protein
MIFFTTKIEPFALQDGSTLNPISCELKTNEIGFFLSNEKLPIIINLIDSWKAITKEDLKIEIIY